MEMFSSACHLGKVFDKYNSNISKKTNYFFVLLLLFFLGSWCRHGSVRQRAKMFRCSGMLWKLKDMQIDKNLTIGKSFTFFSLLGLQACTFLHPVTHSEFKGWCWLFYFLKLRKFCSRRSKIICPSVCCAMQIKKQECVKNLLSKRFLFFVRYFVFY